MSAFNVWWTLGGTVVLVVVLLVRAPKFVSMGCIALSIITGKFFSFYFKKLTMLYYFRTQPNLLSPTSKSAPSHLFLFLLI